MQRFEALRAEQKQLGKQMPKATGDEKAALLARTKELAAEVKAAEAAVTEAEQALRAAQLAVPNVGRGGRAARRRGRLRRAARGRRPARRSTTRATTWSSARRCARSTSSAAPRCRARRFYFLTGVGALLQLGLLQLAIAQAVEYGFTPMITPVLVKPESMEGTGFLGAHASEVYRLEADDLYLVGTSEVPLAGVPLGRDPATWTEPRALRRLVVVLPPGGRLVRQGHARHPAGAPVRQGRDVLVLPARGGARRAPAAARLGGGDAGQGRDPVPGDRRGGRRPGHAARPASTTARRGCRRRAATARSPRRRTARRSRPAG